MKMIRKLVYAFLAIVLCLITLVIYVLMSNLTPEETYFFKTLQKNYRQHQFEVPLKQLTQFDWTKAIWLGSYGGINSKMQIGEEFHSLSKYNLDLEHDGAWALVFIDDNQVTAVIQGKLLRLFGKFRYLSFSRKSEPIEKQYYPNDTIKMNDKFEFTIIRGSK